ATITELEEGEEYDVRVRAQNEVRRLDNGDAVDGWSDWSPVATGSPSSAMRNSRTTSSALSQVGGAVAAGAIDVLGGQLGAASNAASGGAAGGNQSNFTIAGMNLTPDTKAPTALPVRTHADEAAPRHSFELNDLLQLGAFRVSLRHDGDEARGESSAGGASNWAIWGRGNVRGFTAETDTRLELDGEAYAGWLGVDYTHSRSLMGGLAVSYDESRTDYTDPEFGGGEVSTRLGSFYPYLRISPTQALDLWGLMGFGWGSLDFSGEGQEDTSTDMSLQVYALGAQLKLIDLYGAQFSLKSDASFAVLETESQATLPGIRTEPSRMRFALAAQYPWQIDSVSRVTPSVELGGRLDFNEVSGGAGMELGGAVNYNHSTLRLNAEARARGLVYHNDPNVQDWGVSFQLRVDPNQFGQGFFASFAPHWGQSQSRVQRLWRDLDAPQGLAQDMSLQPHQMEAEFGYGFALPRMKATLSPFGRTRFAQTGAQTFSLGSRLPLGGMKLGLTGEQHTAPLPPPDPRLSLPLSMPLGK
ncbi:MAG: fibronectin type III domain-containing protein, partial [Hyphomicrobiales bacterium]|nr:fibronectin type III domain-containing protein [Hyphomicrobiales bacterium]